MGLKIASLFSGIGAWEAALRDMGIEHELQFFSEIDKYAIKSYCAIHGETEEKNIGDITKISDEVAAKLPDIDILCYSPPCQAFSVAGSMKGFEDNRGILFFDAMRIIKAKKPKYALMENVKGLTTKKFRTEFGEMLKALVDAGYTSYWMVLNTKNYGIPQNRERVFVISMLEDKGFNKPKEVHNGLVLRDILEDEVDEKYYLSQDKVDKLIANLNKAGTLETGCNQGVLEPKRLGNVYGEQFGTGYAGNVWDKDYISPTLTTMQGGGRQPMTLLDNIRIRKLTPKECWRLQGFKDSDIDKCIEIGISNTQLYKQAGNSITVDVCKAIFKEIFNIATDEQN